MKRSVAWGLGIVLGWGSVSGCSEADDAGGGAGGSNASGGADTGRGGAGAGTGGSGGDAIQSGRLVGRVIDQLGYPRARTRVVVDDEVVITDDEGVFEVEDVGATYDLAVRTGGPQDASMWLGLTQRDPLVVVQVYHEAREGSASLRGRLNGYLGSERVAVSYICDTGESGMMDTIEFNYDFSIRRISDGPSRCMVFAYEHDRRGSNGISSFVSQPFTLPASSEAGDEPVALVQDLELEAVEESATVVPVDFVFERSSTDAPAPYFMLGDLLLPVQLVEESEDESHYRAHLPPFEEKILFWVEYRGGTNGFYGLNDERWLREGAYRFARDRRLVRVAPETVRTPRSTEFEVESLGSGTYCFYFASAITTAAASTLEICSSEPRMRLPDLSGLEIREPDEGMWFAKFFEGASGDGAVRSFRTEGFWTGSARIGFEFESN